MHPPPSGRAREHEHVSLECQLASLTDVHWTLSGEIVLMTLIGGLGRFSGPVVGAFVLIALEHYFAEAGGWVTVIQGGVFVLFVLTFHQGILGWLVGPEAMDTGFSLASVILSYFPAA